MLWNQLEKDSSKTVIEILQHDIERRKQRHESLIEAEIGTYGTAGATLFKKSST